MDLAEKDPTYEALVGWVVFLLFFFLTWETAVNEQNIKPIWKRIIDVGSDGSSF